MSINRSTSYTIMKNVQPKKYYYFEQNNVQGVLLFDEQLKISNNVIIRAISHEAALEKLYSITDKIDTPHLNTCQCCGKRCDFIDEEFFLQNIVIHIEQKSKHDKIFIHE